jgi:hypothetical protein
MEVKRHALLISGALLCCATTAAMADSATTPDVSAEVNALKAQVAAQQAQIAGLQAKSDQNWLNEQRTDEIKGLIRDALADADTRASLAADGTTSGNDGQFFIKTADDSFRLNIGGLAQVRYVATLRGVKNPGFTNDASDTVMAGHEDGFQMRRIELDFSGYIGSPKFDYAVTLRFDNGGHGEFVDGPGVVGTNNSVVLAELGYKFDLGGDQAVRIFGGRFYDRFSREAMMGAGKQQTVERSAVDYIFAANDDITEGVGIEWNPLPEYLKVAATFNNGIAAGSDSGTPYNTNGYDFNTTNVDYSFTARADVKIVGDWAQAQDVESWSTAPDLQIFVGGGFHYEDAKHGQGNAQPTLNNGVVLGETSEWTADALLKCHGFGMMGSFYGLYLSDVVTGGPTSLRTYGATVQAGYTIADKVEPFARYEWIFPDEAASSQPLNLVTVGANYFIKKHVAKFTVDAIWALNNISNGNTFDTDLTGTGLLIDEAGRKDQVVIRAQFQLMF